MPLNKKQKQNKTKQKQTNETKFGKKFFYTIRTQSAGTDT